jgi:ABC-2 type transport system ATP-binding protein
MLELLRTLANRHHKSLVLSTHLLGDIDRVCDSVIILDRGRIMSIGRIDELRADCRGRFRLTWHGRAGDFLADLKAEGVKLVQDGQADAVIAEVPEGWSNRTFFALADNRSVVLRGIEPLREDLDEVYQRVVQRSTCWCEHSNGSDVNSHVN